MEMAKSTATHRFHFQKVEIWFKKKPKPVYLAEREETLRKFRKIVSVHLLHTSLSRILILQVKL